MLVRSMMKCARKPSLQQCPERLDTIGVNLTAYIFTDTGVDNFMILAVIVCWVAVCVHNSIFGFNVSVYEVV